MTRFEEAILTVAKPQSLSLIDTVSAGYQALNRRLWVLLVPVALDLYLWLGARLSFAPLLDDWRTLLGRSAALLTSDRRQQEQLVLALLNADMRSALALLNFVPLALPALGQAGDGPALVVSGLGGAAAAALLVNLLALLVSSLFLTLLAGGARNETFQLQASLRRVPHVARDIGRYLLALLGIGMLLGAPLLALSAVLATLLPGSALLLALLWYVALFWVYVYTGFAVEAILMSGVGPLRAISNSVNIVRRNLLATLGLLLLSFVVVSGLGVVWRTLATSVPGVLLAIGASAYVSSGLAAARLVFYSERLARWRGLA